MAGDVPGGGSDPEGVGPVSSASWPQAPVQPPPVPGWGAAWPGPAPHAPTQQGGWTPGGPSWGSPPPAYPPYTAQPPYWGYAPTGWQAGRPRESWARRKTGVVVALLVIGIIGLLGAGCVALAANTIGPAFEVTNRIRDNSGGELQSVSYYWNNGTGTFSVYAAPGVTRSEAEKLACEVVRPAIDATGQFRGTHFAIYDSEGYLLADWRTPCR